MRCRLMSSFPVEPILEGGLKRSFPQLRPVFPHKLLYRIGLQLDTGELEWITIGSMREPTFEADERQGMHGVHAGHVAGGTHDHGRKARCVDPSQAPGSLITIDKPGCTLRIANDPPCASATS